MNDSVTSSYIKYWTQEVYRMGEKSPYTDQYATKIWFESRKPWLHVQWIHMCTLMLDIQTDAPSCPLWRTSEHFCSNCSKGVFDSSAQIFVVVVVVVATRSHSYLDNTPQRIVWYGKVRTMWWPWQWCQRCRWATANPAAWKMLVQNIAHRKSEVCGCPIVLQSHVIQESSVSQPRYEPRLRHCRIRCRIHRSIEKVRYNQIIWRHTRPYHHMQWIMFQLLLEIGILLWTEHHISVARTAIVGSTVWLSYLQSSITDKCSVLPDPNFTIVIKSAQVAWSF